MFLCLSTSPHAFEDALITGCGKVFMYVCCRLSQWHNLKDGRDLPNCQISRSCGWPILCFLDGQYFAVTFHIQSHLLAHIKFHFHVVAWTFHFSRDIAKCIASLIIWHWTAAFVWPGHYLAARQTGVVPVPQLLYSWSWPRSPIRLPTRPGHLEFLSGAVWWFNK